MSKKINIISPFGPKLAKIKLSKKIVSDINQEVERIILNKKKSKIDDKKNSRCQDKKTDGCPPS